jgi:GntR family transcriptional regulator
MPSEIELAERFSVSRMTARHAVQNLAREGLLRRKRGSGTYVAPRPMHRREGMLMGFTEDMRQRGKRASSRLLEAGLQPATAAEAEALRVGDGDIVVRIRRIRLADGVPIALENAVLPLSCSAVLTTDLEQSLHESLARLGRVPTVAHSWITAAGARRGESGLLEIPTRSPLLVERRIILDAAGEPLEDTETRYVAERYVLDAVFTLSQRGARREKSSALAVDAASHSR